MSTAAGHIFGVDDAAPAAPGRRRGPTGPVADLSAAAVAQSKRDGTYESPGHLCGSCRRWTDAIWYVLPQYPRTQFCAACATAIGQGPRPREARDGHR